MINYKIYRDIVLISSGTADSVKCISTIGTNFFQQDHVPLIGMLKKGRQNVVISNDRTEEEIEIEEGLFYFANNELILMTEKFVDIYEGEQ